jgi:tetratricopeptide (TPR) repeat protein
MNVPIRRPIFHRRSQSNVYRMFFWVVLILGGLWFIRQVQSGVVKPLFLPTPTPTRTANSFALEGEAQFTAGQLDAAIAAYQEAVKVEPLDADSWAKLARIQTYSTALLVADAEQKDRLTQALESIDRAAALSPDDSTVHAIRAFVLDWNANPVLMGTDLAQEYLAEAEREAVRALQLDNANTLALAFYAEILVDQQKWTQGELNIRQALERNPSLMDVHRVNAYVQESLGQYTLAIQSYERAISIAPNLTFLYLRAGANYRRLAFDSQNADTGRQLAEKSLEYFAKAAQINDQLGVQDPVPYLSISRTYSQMGEFFIAARNVQRALDFDLTNADMYGQLGIIYFKSRNYEGSIPTLACAVRGCSGEDSCIGRGLVGCDEANPGVVVQGLPLSLNTVDYYQVYFSVLAALGPRDESYCPEALRTVAEVQASGFIADRPDIANNIIAAEQYCADLAGTGAPASGSATEAPTVEPVIEVTPNDPGLAP